MKGRRSSGSSEHWLERPLASIRPTMAKVFSNNTVDGSKLARAYVNDMLLQV
jgi:hypothetical protein